MDAYLAAEAERAEYIRQYRPELLYYRLDANQLRFVDIEPGQWHDPIICKLRVATFTSLGHYQALSYVWGSPRCRKSIQVNGRPLLVTVNLELALRFIRPTDQPATFWIDAVCINQEDKEERNHQVGMMKKIYTAADSIIAYLGHPWVHHPHARRLVEKHMSQGTVNLDESSEGHISGSAIDELHSLTAILTKNGKVFSAQQVLEFIALLSRSENFEALTRMVTENHQGVFTDLFEGVRALTTSAWWTRVWILQEIILPDKVLVTYGNVVLSWHSLHRLAKSRALEVLSGTLPSEYGKSLKVFIKLVCSIDQKRQEWRDEFATQGSNLLSLLREVGGRRASDDRDHIYALLGLVKGPTSIVANYFHDTQQVYGDATVDILQRDNGSLRALHGDLSRKGIHILPSWVPDWSATQADIDKERAYLMEVHARFPHQKKQLWLQKTPWRKPLEMKNFAVLCEVIEKFAAPETKIISQLFSRAHRCELNGHSEALITELKDLLYLWSSSGDWYSVQVLDDNILEPTSPFALLHRILSKHHGQLVRCTAQHGETNSNRRRAYNFRARLCDEVHVVSSPVYPLSTETRPAEVSLHIKNILRTLRVNEYAISKMDNLSDSVLLVHETGSSRVSFSHMIRAMLCDLIPDATNELRRFDPGKDWSLVMGWWRARRNACHETTSQRFTEEGYSDLDSIFLRGGQRRRFFVTSSGNCGWGPLLMERYDEVYCPQTCSTPLMIRHHHSSKFRSSLQVSEYKLVGDCFLLDQMGSGSSHRDLEQHVKQLLFLNGRPSSKELGPAIRLDEWFYAGARHLESARPHLRVEGDKLNALISRVHQVARRWEDIMNKQYMITYQLENLVEGEFLDYVEREASHILFI